MHSLRAWKVPERPWSEPVLRLRCRKLRFKLRIGQLRFLRGRHLLLFRESKLHHMRSGYLQGYTWRHPVRKLHGGQGFLCSWRHHLCKLPGEYVLGCRQFFLRIMQRMDRRNGYRLQCVLPSGVRQRPVQRRKLVH